MANVVSIGMTIDGMTMVLEVEQDDGSITVLEQTFVPPPCDCPPALTRAEIAQMIEAHSCSGVAV